MKFLNWEGLVIIFVFHVKLLTNFRHICIECNKDIRWDFCKEHMCTAWEDTLNIKEDNIIFSVRTLYCMLRQSYFSSINEHTWYVFNTLKKLQPFQKMWYQNVCVRMVLLLDVFLFWTSSSIIFCRFHHIRKTTDNKVHKRNCVLVYVCL